MERDMIFRKAAPGDTGRIMQIIAQAREQMRLRGSMQWQGAYPSADDIRTDIAAGCGYVIEHDGEPVAYGAVVFDGEPAYFSIDGAWPNDNPYVVVHRLAVADKMKQRGIGALFMQETADLARGIDICDFRVDTNFDNIPMKSVLCKLGSRYCGEIMYEGDKRMAYHKSLK